jgi:hypothetical protein
MRQLSFHTRRMARRQLFRLTGISLFQSDNPEVLPVLHQSILGTSSLLFPANQSNKSFVINARKRL